MRLVAAMTVVVVCFVFSGVRPAHAEYADEATCDMVNGLGQSSGHDALEVRTAFMVQEAFLTGYALAFVALHPSPTSLNVGDIAKRIKENCAANPSEKILDAASDSQN